MTWRGTATPQDRLFASLPYLLPLMEVCLLAFCLCHAGYRLVRSVPCVAAHSWCRLAPSDSCVHELSPSPGLIVFILLLTLVVRNTNVSHFIRFNTMQAILLDIIIFDVSANSFSAWS
jgi:hypothetical protein